MIELGEEPCAQENKPDIPLYHEFPLTGYIYGEHLVKLTQAITVLRPETDALGGLVRSCDAISSLERIKIQSIGLGTS